MGQAIGAGKLLHLPLACLRRSTFPMTKSLKWLSVSRTPRAYAPYVATDKLPSLKNRIDGTKNLRCIQL